MDNKTVKNYKVAIDAIRGARDECETIAQYLERLDESYAVSPNDAAIAEPQYMNIIKDEMNHCLRFIFNIVVPITGIEPDMDGLEGDDGNLS
ncbi:MAG: hypothetical protein K2M89_06400 [Clostridiales bacterium]|nr:hypothetical protein [Clostridiales bacterium]